jgi:CHASE2 domain-containing sensor protein
VAGGEVLLSLAPALSRVQRVSFHALAEAGPRDLPQVAVLVIGVTAAGLGPEFQVPASGPAHTLRGAEVQAAAVMALAAGAAITPLDARTGGLLAALATGGCLAMAAFSSRRLLLLIPIGLLALTAVSLLLAVYSRLWWAPGPASLAWSRRPAARSPSARSGNS